MELGHKSRLPDTNHGLDLNHLPFPESLPPPACSHNKAFLALTHARYCSIHRRAHGILPTALRGRQHYLHSTDGKGEAQRDSLKTSGSELRISDQRPRPTDSLTLPGRPRGLCWGHRLGHCCSGL